MESVNEGMSDDQHASDANQLDPNLLKALSSTKPKRREEAERRLAELGPDAVPILLAVLREESRKRARNKRALGWAAVGFVLLMFLVALFSGWDQVSSFTSFVSVFATMAAATQLQKGATSALAEYDDVRGVGAFATALEFDDKKVASKAEAKLIALLPRLNASDSTLLDADQRKCLCRALLKRQRADLALAILRALEQVGGEDVLETVAKVAKGEGRAAVTSEVVRAAQDALPAVRHRSEIEQSARLLLRPSSAPDDASAILLRPAMGAEPANPAILLRPVEDLPQQELGQAAD